MVTQELYGCYTFIPEGDGTKVTYKLRVEPGMFCMHTSAALWLPEEQSLLYFPVSCND